MRHRSFLALGVAAAMSAAGCATSPHTPTPPTVIDPSAADLIATEALALWLSEQGPREAWLKITAGKDAGKSWHVVPKNTLKTESESAGVPSTPRAQFTLTWTLEGEPAPRSEREMIVNSGGDLVMERVTQRDRSVITVFDPPVLVVPARINAGAVVRQDGKVVVYELKNPKKIKEKGDYTLEARYDDEVESTTPEGAPPQSAPLQGTPRRLRQYTTRLTLDLSAAKSERFTTRLFAPPPPQGTGELVSESFEEKIRVLGVTVESTRQTMTVAGTSDADCEPTP
jgi:uncharacterized lipoprotein YbaY